LSRNSAASDSSNSNCHTFGHSNRHINTTINAFGNGDLEANGYAHAKTHTNSGCQQAAHLQH
jgi:hypothetical protein